jgi:hypothetical protein
MSPGTKEKDEDIKPITPPPQQQQQQQHIPHQPFFSAMPQHYANPGVFTINFLALILQIIK